MIRLLASLLLTGALCAWSAAATAQTARYGKVNNGLWNAAATWSTTVCGAGGGAAGVPVNTDPVTICPGITVILNTTPAPATGSLGSLDVQGTLNIGNNNTARTLNIGNGGVTIANGGTLQYSSNGGHVINVSGTGTFTNNGTFTSIAAGGGVKTLTVAGLLTNTNGFQLAGGAAITVNATGGLTNSGTINYATAQAHTVVVTGALNNTNSLTSANVGGARTLSVSGLLTNSGTLRFNGSAAMTVNANGGISNSGTLDVDAASNNTHNLTISGNMTNSGTFDLAPGLATDLVNTTFAPNGTLTVSGNGGTTRFNRITVNGTNTSINDIVHMTADKFTLASIGGNGIAITDGTFHLSSVPPAPPVTIPIGTAALGLGANTRLWLDSSGITLTHTGNTDITVDAGELRIDAGTFTASATAANKQLLLQTTGLLAVNGGSLSVGGRVTSGAAGGAGVFTMTGGTVTLGTFGNTTNNTGAPLFLGTASTFNMSGGTIVIERHNAAGGSREYDVRSPTFSVTGGTLQLGNDNTPAAQDFQVNSVPNLWNLTVQNNAGLTSDPTATLIAAATIAGNLTIGSETTFADAGFIATVNGNIANSGTHSGTGSILLSGAAAAHQLSGNGTYQNLQINDAQDATLTGSPTVGGTLTLTNGIIASGTNTLTIGTAGSTASASAASHVQGNVAKVFPAAASFLYPVGDGVNYTPVTVNFTALGTPGNLTVSTPSVPTVSDHPNTVAGTTPAEPNKSVNRYWTLKNSTLAGTANVTLNYLSGSPLDLDSGVAAASFIVGRGGQGSCSGTGSARLCTSWARPVVAGPGATQITASAVSISNAAGESDFVVGEARRVSREKEFIYTRETY